MDLRIQLNNEENELFSVLMNVVKKHTPQTIVYAAGGWVRDKLLGKTPKDIDIMIETMSGEEFARLVASTTGSKNPHVIQSNPDKSKHVQTAKADIVLPSGKVMEVDFARARTESYDASSRVPSEVRPATAKEDASRRDLTINALFYNIGTGKVEDFTGQGLSDLNSKILRSPGDPKQRLMEDPLRVMRVARFSGKLGWDIEPRTKAAMGDKEVLGRLLTMTASERIGEEFASLASTEYPGKGLEVLKECGVLESLLDRSLTGSPYEGTMHPWDMDQDNPHHDLKLWDHTLKAVNKISEMYPVGSSEKAIGVLTALLHDTGKRHEGGQQKHPDGHTSYHGHEDHSRSIAELFLKSLHLNTISKTVCPLVEYHMRPHVLSREGGDKAMRRLLRELAEQGVDWRDLMNMAMADISARKDELAEDRLVGYRDLVNKMDGVVQDMNKKQIDPMGCILNGNEIMQAMGRTDSGPWIKDVKQWLKDFQDTDPNVNKEQAMKAMREQFPEHVRGAGLSASAQSKGNMSKTLLDEKEKQIFALLKERPTEAVSMAVRLWEGAPNDDRAVKLWLKSIVLARTRGGKNLATDAAIRISSRLAKKDFCDPEAAALHLACKLLMNEALSKEDIGALERANHIDPRITRGIMGELIPLANETSVASLKRILES